MSFSLRSSIEMILSSPVIQAPDISLPSIETLKYLDQTNPNLDILSLTLKVDPIIAKLGNFN